MSDKGQRLHHPLLSQEPFDGLRDYSLLSLAGLFVVTLILFLEDYSWWAVLPLLTGCLSVLTIRGAGPTLTAFLLFIILAMGNLLRSPRFSFSPPPSPLVVLGYAAGMMVYVIGHSRLVALRGAAIPGDPRRSKPVKDERVAGRWLLSTKDTTRSPGQVRPGEMATLLGTIPVTVLLAYLVWINLSLNRDLPETELPVPIRQLLLVGWAGGVVLIVGWGLGGYLTRAGATGQESLMYLQDEFWNATRGEQRRITRWVVWRRLRGRGEEKPT